MVSNTELNSNYIALAQLPIVKRTLKCVKRLTNENKELKKENEMLKKMIDTLFDKLSDSKNTIKKEPVKEVYIKKEKVVIDISEEPENITYELRDTCTNTDEPFAYDDDGNNTKCNETKITNDMVEDKNIVEVVEESVEEEEEEEEV